MKHDPGAWTHLTPRPSGYVCPSPFFFEVDGEIYKRDCGKCARCLAAKMRDATGRAAAEAFTSDQVIFFTLTYRPGSPGAFQWITEDRQKFLRALRDKFREEARKAVGAPRQWRRKCDADGVPWKERIAAATKRVRYFGCGEVGKRGTRRNHWHIIAYVSGGLPGPCGWRSTPLQPDGKQGREIISIWPHGVVNVQVLDRSDADRVRAVRYCAKYIQKMRDTVTDAQGDRPGAVMFRSLKPCLGAEFLRQQAAEYVKAGLPLAGFFKVPGVAFSNGKLTENCLTGVARLEWVKGYMDAFRERHGPDAVPPESAFLERFDEEYVAAFMARRDKTRARYHWRRLVGSLPQRKSNRMPPRPDGLAGFRFVYFGSRQVGHVQMLSDGVCVWCPADGKPQIIPDEGCAGVPGLKVHAKALDDWIAARRRSVDGWLSPRQRFEMYEDLRLDRLRAVLRLLGFKAVQVDENKTLVPMTRTARALKDAAIRDGDKLLPLLDVDGVPQRRRYRPADPEKAMRRDEYRRADRILREEPMVLSCPADLKGQMHWPGKPRFMRSAP